MRNDVKVRDFNNGMQTNHRPVFHAHDSNITKHKPIMQKPSKNNPNLMYLETIKMDKTYMN